MENPNPNQNQRKIPLYNPLLHDFTFEYLDDANVAHIYMMRPMELTYFDPPVARFMQKHLADAIYNERGPKKNSEDDLKQIYKEISEIIL